MIQAMVKKLNGKRLRQRISSAINGIIKIIRYEKSDIDDTRKQQ